MSKNYNADSIVHLEGLQAVRTRPGMYIGDTDETGYHHLLNEILANSTDEASNGYGKKIEVVLHKDGSVSVKDEGRGIPVGINKKGREVLELVFMELHSGGKFDSSSYKAKGGLHGIGTGAVNALSKYLEVTVFRDGKEYFQRYENVKGPIEPVKVVGTCSPSKTGTIIKFLPDSIIFGEDISFDYNTICDVIKISAYLNPGITYSIKDKSTGASSEYRAKHGLKDYIEDLMEDKKAVTDIIHLKETGQTSKGVHIETELAIVYCPYTTHKNNPYKPYINSIFNTDGGAHLNGTLRALTSAINTVASKNKLLTKSVPNLTSHDIKESLLLALSVTYHGHDLEFTSQTKEKLKNEDIGNAVEELLTDSLTKAINKDKSYLAVITKLIEIKDFKQKSKRESSLSLKKNDDLCRLVPNLADCHPNTDWIDREIFLVEGDSAEGTAKKARNRLFQAILPLRGKVTNVAKKPNVDPTKDKSIRNIFLSIGCGYGTSFDIKKLRYGKIIILSDADVDGGHITSLLLTMFNILTPKLIEAGHIYVAKPPLYAIDYNGDKKYFISKEELDVFLAGLTEAQKGKIKKFERFKGLGEMNHDKLAITMSPDSREIIKVTPELLKGEVFDMMASDASIRVAIMKEYVNNFMKK